MATAFYNAFDEECLFDTFNRERKVDYRTIFHQDRDRILFSPAFRRLQAKTQVFQAGEYDFYRTRLTHSLEVSRVAESIALFLRKRNSKVAIDLHLLEAICLAHDIGHPPFGHAGERVLNKLMRNYGGFEGNAQTLRILTKTIYSRSEKPGERGGMSPSRALVDGVLKYKRLYRDRGDDTHHFIYDDQATVLDFCFERHDIGNDFKSLECQIMDFADDVAYSCFDIIDGSKARFLTSEKLEKWQKARNRDPKKRLGSAEIKHLKTLKKWILTGNLQSQMNVFLGKKLIQKTSLKPRHNFMGKKTKRYGYHLIVNPTARKLIALQKDLCKDLVYRSGALQQIEFKGGEILRKLAVSYFKNYLPRSAKEVLLVPPDLHQIIIKTSGKAEKARLLCDHLSGMTDAYALRSYKRLFDPDYGSISELI